jgi:hypothetical protein
MIEWRNLVGFAAVVEVVQRADEVAEHGATETAVLEDDDGIVACGGQRMIDADLAKLIYDYRGPRQSWIAERAIE